jgi:hypothetical protein
MCRRRNTMAFLWMLIALVPLGASGADPGEKGVSIPASVLEAADQAAASTDVKALVESAFALYPLEAGRVKNSKYSALLNKAGDLVLAEKNPRSAAEFLDKIGPIGDGLATEKREQLVAVMLGKSLKEDAADRTGKLAPQLAKYGPDLGNPDIQLRGEITRDVAEACGMAVLVYCRPSCTIADTSPRMLSYSFTRPRAGRLRLSVKLRYHGALTDNPYDATVVMEGDLDPMEIRYIRYDDDNIWVKVQNNPQDLVDPINDFLAKN